MPLDYMGRQTTTFTAPANAPVDLNSAGKPDWRELAPLFGLVVLCVVVSGIGFGIIVLSWPATEYAMNGWRLIGIIAGGSLAFAGGSFFWTLRTAILRGIRHYYIRIDDWHNAVLDKYIEGPGQVVAQQVTERHLVTTDARHMLLLLLYVYLSNQQPSIRTLTAGPLLVRSNHRAFSLGAITQDQASEALDLFARSGIILDRGPKTAGKLALLDFKTAANKLLGHLATDPRIMDSENSLLEDR